MKKYLLFNDFAMVILENYTDLNIDEFSKYFYNYINIIEYDSKKEITGKKIVLKDVKDFHNQNNASSIYTIENHKLIQDNNNTILFINSREDILYLKRFIIDYINRIIEIDNNFFLHGSSVVKDGQSIIFTGEKMSGKTTNMLQFLDECGYNYSSNEKVAIIKKNDNLYSYGCPSNINVRVGTLKYNPNLFSNLSSYINPLDYYSLFDENQIIDEKRIVFTAENIANAFDAEIKPTGKIKCICNLTFLPEVDFSMRELSYIEKLSIIRRNLISGIYPTRKDIIEEILPIDSENKIDFLDSLRYYNVCHNNRNNNAKKIVERIKEDIDESENKRNIKKLQYQCNKDKKN